jgi:hypothetical protein
MYYFDLYTQDLIIFYICRVVRKGRENKKTQQHAKQNIIIMFEMRHMRHAGTEHTETPQMMARHTCMALEIGSSQGFAGLG